LCGSLSSMSSTWQKLTTGLGRCPSRCLVSEVSCGMYPSYQDLYRWLYGLFLAIDTNFQLVQKNMSSDIANPGLSKGWMYLIEKHKYKMFLQGVSKQLQEVYTLSSQTYYSLMSFQLEKHLCKPQCCQSSRDQEFPWPHSNRSWDCWLCIS
jgi:hypothetical protein